jgi:hypothetical protein
VRTKDDRLGLDMYWLMNCIVDSLQSQVARVPVSGWVYISGLTGLSTHGLNLGLNLNRTRHRPDSRFRFSVYIQLDSGS